jgi:predicted dehydrogenase
MSRRSFIAGIAAAGALGSRSWGEQKRWRACVIGDYDRGGYGHGMHQLWALRDDIDVIALAEPHEQARQHYAQEAGAQKTYADYREMLAAEKPDLVAIGPRWTVNHREYLLACAEVGAHGILEKPLTPDLAGADEAIAALEAKNLKWSMAFNFRAAPIVRHAHKLVGEGLIGRVLEMRARGKEDARSGGEDLIVLGVHTFDLMRYFAGDPRWCEAEVQVDGKQATAADVREATEPLGPIVGDTVHATWGFSNGVRGYFDSVKGAEGGGARWGLSLYGTDGVITIRMTPVPQVRWLASPAWTEDANTSNWQPLPDAPAIELPESAVGHYKPIVDDLIESIAQDREPFTSVQAGRAAHEFIQAVFETQVLGKRVPMPLEQRSHPLERWS